MLKALSTENKSYGGLRIPDTQKENTMKTPEQVLEMLRACGCRKYENETNEEYLERSKKLQGHFEGSWCDYDCDCPNLTEEEVIAFASKYGCICANLPSKVVCSHCCDKLDCFPDGNIEE